ncbi:tyrosine-type recombinase/integrase [Akkermansiaceae bacterium]|nr:tyrosine-type recombinase/integrase [Akkermansiaceae bacterium]
MAFVTKRPGGSIFYACWKGANGKQIRRSTGLTSKREAQKRANEWESNDLKTKVDQTGVQREFTRILETGMREAEGGDLTLSRLEELLNRAHRIANPDYREVSVGSWYSEWSSQQAAYVSDSTQNGYRNDFDLLKEALGSKKFALPLRELTSEDVRKAIAKAHKDRTASTVNKALSSFRRAIDAALAENLVSSNVVKQVRPLKKTDSTKRAPFTLDEVRTLLNSAKTDKNFTERKIADEWVGFITLGAHTGLRASDLCKLTRKNVSGDSIELVVGKTGKTLKVPLSPPCIGWIGKKRGAFFKKLALQPGGTTSTQFTNLMKKAGVPRDIVRAGDQTARRSFHSLRHTFTSWLANQDIHADVRQKLTGHSSAGIHALYTHHDESLVKAIETLPAL